MSITSIVGITLGVIVFVILVMIVCWIIATYNALSRRRNNVDEAFVFLDNYLKKRYDMLSQILSKAQDYFAQELVENIKNTRNIALASKNVDEQLVNDANLSKLCVAFLAEFEKIAQNNAELQQEYNEFLDVQKEINSAVIYYNGMVKVYNSKRGVFPANIISKWFKFEEKKQYIVDEIK